MMIRGSGFYRDGDPPEPQPLGTAALAILLVVSVVGAAIVLLAWALLLTAGQ